MRAPMSQSRTDIVCSLVEDGFRVLTSDGYLAHAQKRLKEMSDSTADVQQCCAVVLHEIERGVVFLRNSHNLSGDIAEICQRRAERLVQWTLAIKSLVVDGESLFQAIREAIDAEVQENTRPKRGRPSILISEHQLLFLLEHGVTVAQMAAFFGCSQRTVERRMQEHGMMVTSLAICTTSHSCMVTSYIIHDEPLLHGD